jgi:hypothetical protein
MLLNLSTASTTGITEEKYIKPPMLDVPPMLGYDIAGRGHIFFLQVKDDMTPLERGRISVLLSHMTHSPQQHVNIESYIAQHGIERHFKRAA